MSEINSFREKVIRSPNNLFFRYSFAQLLANNNQAEEAILHLNICLKNRDDWMMAVMLKDKLELGLGRKEEAMVSLEKTIELAEAQDHQDPLSEASEILTSLQNS